MPLQAFGQPKQESLMAMRERTGQAVRRKVRDSLGITLPLSQADKILLREISIASEQRKWQEVQSHFDAYSGQAIQIYTAVMNAAVRCRRYSEGAVIYERCRETCEQLTEPTFTAAIKIFGKLGQHEKVRQIWAKAIKECKLSEILIGSRIDAAADEGDVETAAAMLDLLQTNKLEINKLRITSALRSCWGWGPKQHKAAKYLWKLFAKLNVKPDVAAFTTLMGAYSTAPLQDVLAAKAEMDSLEIEPNRVFGETFLTTVLQQDFKHLKQFDDLVRALTDKPPHRLQAARVTLENYEATGVEMTRLCKKIRAALQILKQQE
eukprot:Skav230546  [mRNA]  locus=scaffold1365:146599:147561:+ [translate_table: standard]